MKISPYLLHSQNNSTDCSLNLLFNNVVGTFVKLNNLLNWFNIKLQIEQRLGSSFNLLNNLISLYNKGFQFTIRYKNIGNQISNHQSFYHKQDNKDNKIEISKFFNDNKKTQIQIIFKDLHIHKSQMQKSQSKKSRNSNQRQNEIIEKLNKTQNENLQELQRFQWIKNLQNYSLSTEEILISYVIPISPTLNAHEQDSPDICKHNRLQSTIRNSLLIRSGSQGNTASTSKLHSKMPDSKLNIIKNYLEQAQTHRPITDSYKLSHEIEKQKKINQFKLKEINFYPFLKLHIELKIKQIDLISIYNNKKKFHLESRVSFQMNYHLKIILNQSYLQNEFFIFIYL
ncbi:unnamed protein product [Paramecium sonneborni]|uniref:Uncharacterized protein n=1 Tax=Paramecium sonneborni TaxID=65129 RepID=A0A8S1PZD8_9CILI|nr:unnamed protein product [Paramecium sonneborni]